MTTIPSMTKRLDRLGGGNEEPTVDEIWLVPVHPDGTEGSGMLFWRNPNATGDQLLADCELPNNGAPAR